MLRGTVDRVRFRGASLEGNALGDAVERELIVYLPPGYESDARAGRRYPVVMVLAGFAGTNSSLVGFKPWEPNLLERYERLLPDAPEHLTASAVFASSLDHSGALEDAPRCGEAIFVLPDCFTRLGGSQYLDSPAVGNYQRYLADDVLALVDKSYCTLPQRSSRAIVGKSSGGFGALRMGLDRPECFAVIGSHAGDCAFELSIRPRFTESAMVYEKHGGALGFLLRVATHGGPRSQAEFHALELLALAYAYAPVAGTQGKPVGELPFDPHTAQIDPEKWARWLAHDPAHMNLDSLRNARLVFLDAGKSDEYGLQFGARILAQRLAESEVAVDHEEFEGGHMGTAYRYDISLPKIIAALDTTLAATLPTSAHASSATTAHAPRETRGLP